MAYFFFFFGLRQYILLTRGGTEIAFVEYWPFFVCSGRVFCFFAGRSVGRLQRSTYIGKASGKGAVEIGLFLFSLWRAFGRVCTCGCATAATDGHVAAAAAAAAAAAVALGRRVDTLRLPSEGRGGGRGGGGAGAGRGGGEG